MSGFNRLKIGTFFNSKPSSMQQAASSHETVTECHLCRFKEHQPENLV